MKTIVCILSSFTKDQPVSLLNEATGTQKIIFVEEDIQVLGELIADYCHSNNINKVVLGGSSFLKDKVTNDIQDTDIVKYNNVNKIQVSWIK